MAGKKKLRETGTRWDVSFTTESGDTVNVVVSGGECPVATLMNVDRVERDYILRQIGGETVESISFEKIS